MRRIFVLVLACLLIAFGGCDTKSVDATDITESEAVLAADGDEQAAANNLYTQIAKNVEYNFDTISSNVEKFSYNVLDIEKIV